ncbi:MAG: hypothetical protein HPY64_16605 [Anaerolineae bacterium]|nr:hypothetical protein [Anaerolineae bacterium]
MPEARLDSEELASRAAASLLSDPGLREELTDAEAEPLLQWGANQVARLARQAAEQASPEMLDEALDNLRRLMMRMNRLIRLRAEGDTEQVRAELDRLTMLGERLPGAGQRLLSSEADRDSFMAEQATLDNAQVIARVLAMIAPAEPAPPGEPALPEEPAPPSSSAPLPAPEIPEALVAPPAPQPIEAPPLAARLEPPPVPGMLPAGPLPPTLPETSGAPDPFTPPEADEES